ncbi:MULTISPECIES: WhiB family transcriptional regulator [unclassified Modestobacter]|uniref:WhiB family transcriptional regulator n=1 Tax=unclassified Modestobacter TaxID=2643866 RepID=UPI0022AA2FB5|nr:MULTISPECIES: WhiB family transcriptional regulator [unclassified Modestobacter]
MQTTIDPATSHRRPGLDRTHVSTQAPAREVARRGLPCRVQDADLWFAESPAQLEQAKAHCATCPVRSACLAGALDRAEPWGVWGGEIFDHGVVIARKRPRGRPPKVRTEAAA